jgi:hypothetical protein
MRSVPDVSQVTTTTSAATLNVTTRLLRSEHPGKRIEQIRVARDAVSSVGVTMPWRNRPRSSSKSDLPIGTNDKKGAAQKPPL